MAPSWRQHSFPLSFPHGIEQLGVHKGNKDMHDGDWNIEDTLGKGKNSTPSLEKK